MSCPTCDAINAAVLAKAKTVADALRALIAPNPDSLTQDGKAND